MRAPASRRAGRTSSGPATTSRATAPASRSSGKPHRPSRCSRNGVQSDSTAHPSSTPAPSTTTNASARSRKSLYRRCKSTSTTTISASTTVATKSVRHSGSAHPRTVTIARATCSSCTGACEAATAASPRTIAPAPSRTPSIVRRLRRPASATVRSRNASRISAARPCRGMTRGRRMTGAARRHSHATLYRPRAGAAPRTKVGP